MPPGKFSSSGKAGLRTAYVWHQSEPALHLILLSQGQQRQATDIRSGTAFPRCIHYVGQLVLPILVLGPLVSQESMLIFICLSHRVLERMGAK